MKVAIIHNKDTKGVINKFGMQNKEKYSTKAVQRVQEALEKGGHNVRVIDGNMYFIESLKEFMPAVIEGEKMGMVFNMAYGIQGESRYTHIPSMLEMLGIPYIGSSPSGHALALDKVITKIIMQKHNINTPDFYFYNTGDEEMSGVKFPVIVKPKMEAVSFGLKVVDNEKDLREAVKFIIETFKQQALVEQFIPGREFCVGILGNGDPEAFPVLEIDLEGDPEAIQTVDDKRTKPRKKICPADIPQEKAKEMVRLSKEAFRALGLRDFSRVDIRMDKDNNVYILEINSMASLGASGSYVNAAAAAGYDFTALVNKIVDTAVIRYFSQEEYISDEGSQKKPEKTPLSVKARMFLRSKQDYVERLLAKMMNVNNYVRNPEGVNTLSAIVANEVKHLGFREKILPFTETGNIHILTNKDSDNYDFLFVLNMDSPVVYKKQSPYMDAGNRIYGTGAWQAKGGLATLISAFRTLRFNRLLKKMSIALIFTSDNTLYGNISAAHINDLSKRSKCVLGLSGAMPEGTIITSRSGASLYNFYLNLVDAKGPGDIAQANVAFANILAQMANLSGEDKGLLVVPADVSIDSSFAPPYVHSEAKVSVRFRDIAQAENTDKFIKEIISKNKNKKLKMQVRGGIRRIQLTKGLETEKTAETLKKTAKKLDLRAIEEHRWSSSNICFADSSRPVIDGLGPVGESPRDGKEYILKHSIFDRAALLSIFMNDFMKENNK